MKTRKIISLLILILLVAPSVGARPEATSEALRPGHASQDETRKLKIKEKPDAAYTEEAKRNKVEGKVVLRVVFGADGKVGDIQPIRELPNGLTESAVAAAKLIKFEPALKDGQPVAMTLNVAYKFKLEN